MFLETNDAVAVLAYAGVGATGVGTEPADWMSAVLRGRNLPLEDSLGVLSDALKREMPRHLATLAISGPAPHNVLVSALLEGEPRLYTIDLAVHPTKKEMAFRYVRWVDGLAEPTTRTPRFGLAGSGALILLSDFGWKRQLLWLVRAHDRKLISANTVADAFAALNMRVSRALVDGTVGPRCIVAWRHRRNGVHRGGGGHQSYDGMSREPNMPSLPIIVNGMDIGALMNTIMPVVRKQLESFADGEMPTLDEAAIDEAVSRVPDNPDERLR